MSADKGVNMARARGKNLDNICLKTAGDIRWPLAIIITYLQLRAKSYIACSKFITARPRARAIKGTRT